EEARSCGFELWAAAARLHLAERDGGRALQAAERLRKKDKVAASYLAALAYLQQGHPSRALPELEVLQQAFRGRKDDRKLEYQLWETQGLYMCQTGAADPGLKLLARAADQSKSDYGHHAWGNGSYF